MSDISEQSANISGYNTDISGSIADISVGDVDISGGNTDIARGNADISGSSAGNTRSCANVYQHGGAVIGPGNITKHRLVDYVLCVYYAFKLVSTMLMDSQAVYPAFLYPNFLKAVYHSYLDTFHDPFLRNAWKYPWFLSVCLLEHVLGLPFYAFATYSYYYGAVNKPRIILPSIIYSTFAIAGIVDIYFMIMLEDFSRDDELAPQNIRQRFMLAFGYTCTVAFFVINLVDSTLLALKAIFPYRR